MGGWVGGWVGGFFTYLCFFGRLLSDLIRLDFRSLLVGHFLPMVGGWMKKRLGRKMGGDLRGWVGGRATHRLMRSLRGGGSFLEWPKEEVDLGYVFEAGGDRGLCLGG